VENVDARFFRHARRRGPDRDDVQPPDQPHDGQIAGDDDFLDQQRIGIFPGPVVERAPQQAADLVKSALRKAAVIVAQIRSEETADRVSIAGIELPRPTRQGISDRRRGGGRRLRARLSEEKRQNNRRR